MTEPFGHEKLIVYQKGMCFAVLRGTLFGRLHRRVAACDHLERGAESLLLNIAHASSTWSASERMAYLGHANGYALECAACLDVPVAKSLMGADDVHAGKSLLAETVSMLIAMRKTAANRIREAPAVYRTRKGRLFDHEDLDVYQAALQVVAWLETFGTVISCSADLRTKLDKSTTSIVLNIAEGNGRFGGQDRAVFCGIAFKATIQSASLIDLAATMGVVDVAQVEAGRELLRRTAAMLATLSKVATHA